MLVTACFLTMLLSLPLWFNSRPYPVLPLGGRFPVLPGPWDKWFLACTLASLLASAWRYRPAIIVFLAASAFLAMQDQNRFQPWFYLYWVMLLLTLLPAPAALTSGRFVLSAVYVWAGIYKCNVHFFAEVVPLFLGPLNKSLPSLLHPLANLAISASPIVEVLIGLGLWNSRTRITAVAAAFAVHLGALLVLGPWGHAFNAVVWPWNIFMPALVIVLFPLGQLDPIRPTLFSSRWGAAVVTAVCALPLLGRFGWWDSYLSFSLYSGDTARATILVSPALKQWLPASMQRFVLAGDNGALQFDFRNWGEAVMKVPPIPEPRSYLAVARHLANQFAAGPNDLQLILQPRPDQMIVLGGDELRSRPAPRPDE